MAVCVTYFQLEQLGRQQLGRRQLGQRQLGPCPCPCPSQHPVASAPGLPPTEPDPFPFASGRLSVGQPPAQRLHGHRGGVRLVVRDLRKRVGPARGQGGVPLRP